MTPSRPSLKGSTPAMLTVPVGARRLPERRRRRVVLPAPLALSDVRTGCAGEDKGKDTADE